MKQETEEEAQKKEAEAMATIITAAIFIVIGLAAVMIWLSLTNV
jgi:uncharacterized membrane protein